MRASVLLLLLVAAKKKKKTEAAADDHGWEKTTNTEGQAVQQLKVEAPALTEEDQKNVRMPDIYRCEACQAVMFNLAAKLKKAKKGRDLKSWEVVEVFDNTCTAPVFEGYGVKVLGGKNVLSGPGIVKEDNLSPGGASIQMGGETWGLRLMTECKEIVYDRIGEDELYTEWKGNPTFEGTCDKVGLCGAKAEKSTKKKKGDKAKKGTKAEEKKTEPKKAEPASGALNWVNYAHTLIGRGLVPATLLDQPKSQREWDKAMLAMSGKLGSHLADQLGEL